MRRSFLFRPLSAPWPMGGWGKLGAPLAVLASLTFAQAAWSQHRSPGSECGPYSLAFYEHGVLYYRDAQGGYAGIDLDIVNELAKRSGCLFNTVLESRVRIWDQLAKNSLDISVSGIPSPEREQHAEFMLYMQTRNFALLRREVAAKLSTPEAFLADPARRVVVVKSFKHGPFFDAWLEKLRVQQRVTEVPDFDAAVRVFKLGRADAMLALPTSWPLILRREGLQDQISVLDWAPQDRITAGLIVSRQRVHEPDRQRLRSALSSMQRDGTLEIIFKRHVDAHLAKAMRLDASSATEPAKP
ncbi:transporter substrate-binding domain-containing protein [Paucibacter sp. B2R-40]|uniref:substrate-binding periplasmic protein n=1 Tax=Paucibacter sp. B2R-40 TaxID=2893554 RepID=UPI0021E4C364|nr:transporter substrate-binding domain-containing protein [Paucibacter sp. B2R-40]MCV2352893.1 transporter substrate-binding domain-containing protein [Paucibacter sp. B2R-40]